MWIILWNQVGYEQLFCIDLKLKMDTYEQNQKLSVLRSEILTTDPPSEPFKESISSFLLQLERLIWPTGPENKYNCSQECKTNPSLIWLTENIGKFPNGFLAPLVREPSCLVQLVQFSHCQVQPTLPDRSRQHTIWPLDEDSHSSVIVYLCEFRMMWSLQRCHRRFPGSSRTSVNSNLCKHGTTAHTSETATLFWIGQGPECIKRAVQVENQKQVIPA